MNLWLMPFQADKKGKPGKNFCWVDKITFIVMIISNIELNELKFFTLR